MSVFNDRARGIGAGWLLPFTFLSAAATADEAPPEAFSEAFSTVLIQGQKDSLQPSAPVADKGSPQSIVGEEVIHQIASPVGDYGTVAEFDPELRQHGTEWSRDSTPRRTRVCVASSTDSSMSPWTAFPSPILTLLHTTRPLTFRPRCCSRSWSTAARGAHPIWATPRSAARSTSTPRRFRTRPVCGRSPATALSIRASSERH